MATAAIPMTTTAVPSKGLKTGALGLVSSIVIGVASTAPAYSLAATLGFIVEGVGRQTVIVVILAFIPILFCSIGYSELNKLDPDCGTTFTWAGRGFGPRTGWWGGWGILAADILVMASLAQVAGQYVFLLFNAKGIGGDPSSFFVLLVGVGWIIAMSYICYRGIEISAAIQTFLLGIEVLMLGVFSVVALVKVGNGTAPLGSIHPAWAWFDPFKIGFAPFVSGICLMLFIYWGWDSAVSVNEETQDPAKTPGRAAIISTLLLLATYALVTIATESFAGTGSSGIGLANANNSGDVLSILGGAVFGGGHVGTVLSHLLILMVLTSASASTQTTILPTARTTLSMANFEAMPRAFAKVHAAFKIPTVSTIAMGGVSIVLYVALNYISGGLVIGDAVTTCGIYIAFYYGLTGITCAWVYRRNLTSSGRNFTMQGLLPLLGGLLLWFAGGWTIWSTWDVATDDYYVTWLMPFTHWRVGGAFVIFALSMIVAIGLYIAWRIAKPSYFSGESFRRATSINEDGEVVEISGGYSPAT